MKHKFLAAALLMAIGLIGHAQSRSALKINEVMIVNDNSVVDDYGQHSAWIELFNSNFAEMEISKVFITNDTINHMLYPIPLGDVNTKIPRRQHIIFWADGQPDKGTFHTNFVLTPGQDNYIAIYDADGKTLIDEVWIPADLQPNQTYARAEDGFGEWQIRDGEGDRYITPSSSNIIVSSNSKVDFFKERDENGLGLTIIAMAIVFSALLLLAICFFIISKIGARTIRRNKERVQGITSDNNRSDDHDSGEEIAAIVMALHDHLNIHDRESTVLTLNKVRRAYSPWSSKIYNLRELPEVKHNRR